MKKYAIFHTHKQGSRVPPLVQIRNQHFCPLFSKKAADGKGLDKRTNIKRTKDQSKLDRQSDIGEK